MKKIVAFLMAAMMSLMIVGCGGGEKKAAYPGDGDITVIIPKAPAAARIPVLAA